MVRLSSLLRYGRKTEGPVSQHFQLYIWFLLDIKEPTPLERVGDIDPGGVANLSWAGWVIPITRDLI